MTLERARHLRRNQTEAERLLWSRLRDRRLGGYKFRRQVPIDRYITDFLCEQRKLIVELDGSQHAEREDYDQKRSAKLENLGYRVIRFWNNQVFEETDGVLQTILSVLEERQV